ncbi:Protein translocase subunit SecY [Streptomyces tendae]
MAGGGAGGGRVLVVCRVAEALRGARGTSILIIVGVGLETVKQIESQLQQRNYEGFLR